MQHCDVGEPQTTKVAFWNAGDADTDPTTVTLTIKAPDGTVTTPGPSHPSLGHYSYTFTPSQAGVYIIIWDGAGNGVDAHETSELAVGIYQQTGPCEPWCSWDDVVRAAEKFGANLGSLDAEDQSLALDWGTALLVGLTNGRYPGLCRSTFGICACSAHYDCRWRSCTGLADHADLSDCGWPVWGATDVHVNGALLDHASYRIDGRRWLIRLDEQGLWPCCPDLRNPDNARATLIYGQPPFAGGDQACAYFVAFGVVSGAASCGGIPDDVIGMTREGVTYQLDPKQFEEGRTGLGAVDSWLAAEKQGRKVRPGGFDPARDPQLLRLGTDRGGDL